jgi:hypothetical protein
MENQQKWIEVIKKLPAWVSGSISLVTAIIGFVLLLQGHYYLGITILGILGTVLLLLLFAYLAFAKTAPLIEGGGGVYRFENYRPWAMLGLGLVIGIAVSALLFGSSRSFLISAISGRGTPTRALIEASSDRNTPAPAGTQAETKISASPGTCFEEYFSGVPDDRVASMENGTVALIVIDRTQTKEGAAGLRFTEFGRLIGAMKYHIFPNNNLFRIESLVDGECQELAGYSNKSVHDADSLQMRLGDQEYVFSLAYDGGEVYATFEQFSP